MGPCLLCSSHAHTTGLPCPTAPLPANRRAACPCPSLPCHCVSADPQDGHEEWCHQPWRAGRLLAVLGRLARQQLTLHLTGLDLDSSLAAGPQRQLGERRLIAVPGAITRSHIPCHWLSLTIIEYHTLLSCCTKLVLVSSSPIHSHAVLDTELYVAVEAAASQKLQPLACFEHLYKSAGVGTAHCTVSRCGTAHTQPPGCDSSPH